MNVERFGSGDHVFFGLHGWSGDSRTFAPIARQLPVGVSFLSADLPGCGQSAPPAAWTVDAIVGEIARELLKVPHPVTLIGNCSGANLAFFAALRVPEKIHRIVAIDAFAFWPWYFRIFVHPAIGRYAYFSTFANPLGRAFTNLSLRGKRREETSLTAGFAHVDHEATYRYLELLRDAGGIEQFRELTMPIDLVCGERSFEAVRESARRFSRLWPQSRVTTLAGAGHLPIQEATVGLCSLLFEPIFKEPVCPNPTMSISR